VTLSDRSVRSDLVRLALLPPALIAGSLLLLVLAGFGQTPPERLPFATLALFGALFGDALARPLRRAGPTGIAALALGSGLATVAAVGFAGPRELASVAAAVGVAILLRTLPARRAEMIGAMSVYVAATVLANYTLDAFLPVGPWFLINVGTLFFGVTFTQRDRIHRFGRPTVYATIVVAAIANVVAALSLGTPLRYVAVSFLAIVASESADTEVYQRLLARRWLTRVASSNAVSAPIDTILFTVLAFAGAPFATAGWMAQVIVTDVIVKYGSGLVTALLLLPSRRDEGAGPGDGDGRGDEGRDVAAPRRPGVAGTLRRATG
jgi:uncharacterized PurR-regulated membrane protein YhhQ (DUF165 family)